VAFRNIIFLPRSAYPIRSPSQHLLSLTIFIRQVSFNPGNKNIQPVNPRQTGTQVRLYRFKKSGVFLSLQLVIGKRTKGLFIFVQLQINEAIAGG
jgi:hypothetical protein